MGRKAQVLRGRRAAGRAARLGVFGDAQVCSATFRKRPESSSGSMPLRVVNTRGVLLETVDFPLSQFVGVMALPNQRRPVVFKGRVHGRTPPGVLVRCRGLEL